MSRRTRPSLSGGFALAAVTVLVCLLLGEAVSRLSDPEASLWRYPNYIWLATELDAEAPLQLRYDSELGYEPRPGVSGTLKGETLSYSADGFRNHNLDRPTATGPLILALGDSYTEGYAVSDDETWPAHLERDTGRRVLNAGVRSYGLDQIVLRAERLAPRVKPRTMVLAFIESDIGRTALLGARVPLQAVLRAGRTGCRGRVWSCATCRCRPDGPPRRSTACAPSWAIRICSMTSCAAWAR